MTAKIGLDLSQNGDTQKRLFCPAAANVCGAFSPEVILKKIACTRAKMNMGVHGI